MRRGPHQRILKQPADKLASPVLLKERDVHPVQLNVSFVRDKASCDGIEQCGFSRSVRSDNGGKISILQDETDVIQGYLFIDGSRIEGFGSVLDLKHDVPPSRSRHFVSPGSPLPLFSYCASSALPTVRQSQPRQSPRIPA